MVACVKAVDIDRGLDAIQSESMRDNNKKYSIKLFQSHEFARRGASVRRARQSVNFSIAPRRGFLLAVHLGTLNDTLRTLVGKGRFTRRPSTPMIIKSPGVLRQHLCQAPLTPRRYRMSSSKA